MTTENDDLDSSWDNLADELGVDATAAKPAETVQPPVTKHHHQPPVKHAPKPEPEVFEENDFGGGLEEAPKDEEFSDDSDGADADAEGADGEEGSGEETSEGTSEEGEGKKKRRRRRRRRKKGGANPEAAAATPETVDDDSGEFQAVDGTAAVEEEEEETVEEGEAPGEMSDEDDENENLSAVDEEMNTASTGPRQEWKVMSWNELVGKLHRPN